MNKKHSVTIHIFVTIIVLILFFPPLGESYGHNEFVADLSGREIDLVVMSLEILGLALMAGGLIYFCRLDEVPEKGGKEND